MRPTTCGRGSVELVSFQGGRTLQSPAENLVHYVRVIPGWVDQMKAAVDEANR